jgi:histidine triad (HIT) family protein
MAEDSIFTKIIKGEIPCHKVFEDEFSFGFMDIHPIQPGHILLVSKRQVANFYELTDEEYQGLMRAVKKVAKRLKEFYPNKKRIGVMIECLEVDHVHVKIFPINTGNEFRSEPDMSQEPDHAALAELAQKLAF